MRRPFYFITVVLLFLVPLSILGQDNRFSLFNATPYLVNPAASGLELGHTVSFTSRNQWANAPGSFVQKHVGYQYKGESKFSLGLGVTNEIVGNKTIAKNSYSIMPVYTVPLETANLAFSVSLGGVQTVSNYSNLVFESQLDPNNGYVSDASGENIDAVNANKLDIGFGGLYYSDFWYVGASFQHINHYQEYAFDVLQLPIVKSFQAGMRLKTNLDDFKIMSSYQTQGVFDLFTLGAYGVYNNFGLGLAYRGAAFSPSYNHLNHNAIDVQISVKNDKLAFMYNYGLGLQYQGKGLGGTHELAVILHLYKDKARKAERKVIKTNVISY